MNTDIDLIYGDLRKPLMGFIKKRVNNESDAEDILQEVFLKLYSNFDSLRDSGKLHSWIYTIARNTITDYYRSLSRKIDNEYLSEDIPYEVEEKNFDFDSEEIKACLKVMINNLPDKYKQALILTEFENLTQKELSERLGLSLSGAKSRVQRARQLLKDMLYDCCSFEKDHNGSIIDCKRKNKDSNYCK